MTLSACSTTDTINRFDEKTSMLSAVKTNIRAQAIIPTDANKNDTHIPASTIRQNLAIQRYQDDKVEEPVLADTQ